MIKAESMTVVQVPSVHLYSKLHSSSVYVLIMLFKHTLCWSWVPLKTKGSKLITICHLSLNSLMCVCVFCFTHRLSSLCYLPPFAHFTIFLPPLTSFSYLIVAIKWSATIKSFILSLLSLSPFSLPLCYIPLPLHQLHTHSPRHKCKHRYSSAVLFILARGVGLIPLPLFKH